MNVEDIQKVTALMERYGIEGFEYEQGFVQLRLTLCSGSEAAAMIEVPQPAAPDEPDTLLSPGVGVVLHAHPASGATPAVLPRHAAKGEIVAYIKTGLTLRSVTATKDCVLTRALVPEGKGVGYGEALFEIAP